MLQRIFPVFFSDERKRGIGSHTAGIRAFVPLVCTFMVLGKGHRPYFFAIHKAHEREFRTGKEFLDDDLALAEPVVQKHVLQCRVRFLECLRNYHAFARGKSVIFEDNRERAVPDISESLFIVIECPV